MRRPDRSFAREKSFFVCSREKSFIRFRLLALVKNHSFARVKSFWLKSRIFVEIYMKKRLFCASSSIRVVYSERTSSTSRLQQTTWSQSTDRFEFVCPDRRQDYGVHNVVPINWRSIPTRGWSFTNLRRSPSTSEIATRGPNRRTDRRQNRCTTWSRSTQKLSDRPASLEKVEASDRHQDYGAQRGPDWRGIPTRGWSFACLRRFRFEFCNCTQLILLWEFIADIDCVCFLLQQFSAKLLGQT